MKLVIETDIGHDPDDLFALRYLYLKNIPIEGIIVTPGYDYQFALAYEMYPGIPLIYYDNPRNKQNLSKLYKKLTINQQSYKKYLTHISELIISKDNDILVIGPAKGLYISKFYECNKIVFQGGFCPYSVYRPKITLEKFENVESIQSFNPGGCRQGFDKLNQTICKKRMWVSKNICHTVEMGSPNFKDEKMNFVKNHLSPNKKIHDLVAAVLYLRPELATWTDGNMIRQGSGFTTVQGTDKVIVDIDYDSLRKEIECV